MFNLLQQNQYPEYRLITKTKNMPYTYDYPRPSVAVDCVIFGLDKTDLKVLLIQRGNDPYKHHWAFPGGFVEMDESLETAALRELEEETGVKNVFFEQLFTFGNPERDPRGRVISVSYFALVNLEDHPVQAASDAENAAWFPFDKLPELAFDHQIIMKTAFNRLRSKVRYQPLGFELLPEKFTLAQLQELYEKILGTSLNKRNFRTKILKMNILKEVGRQENVAHRPATLYSFDHEQYSKLTTEGFNFEI
jgi:8-oxo-dGTP diphosphatase